MQTEYEMQQQQLAELQERLPLADAERRKQRDAVQELERQLAQTEARLNALQQLQAQLDNDKNLKAWLTQHQLDNAPRLWQSIRIEQGWEDALEAVLRERINALALPRLEDAASWSDAPPAKLAVYAADGSRSNNDCDASRPDAAGELRALPGCAGRAGGGGLAGRRVCRVDLE